jgi:hypothetical protein
LIDVIVQITPIIIICVGTIINAIGVILTAHSMKMQSAMNEKLHGRPSSAQDGL